jgi:hypothetical protein
MVEAALWLAVGGGALPAGAVAGLVTVVGFALAFFLSQA